MFNFLTQSFSSLVTTITGKGHLTEKNMQEALDRVRDALIQADVPLRLVDAFIEEIKTQAVGKKILNSLKPGDQLVKIVHDTLKQFLGGQHITPNFAFQLPATVMVLGLQGSGKTTTLAKMAHYALKQARERNKKRSVLMASVDFYRPAAVDQLSILAEQVGATFYRSPEKDPVKAANDIQAYAQAHQFELLFLDTAGRLHVDGQMLEELRRIDTNLQPCYKILVLDAMTGQESIRVAEAFEQGVGYQYAVLTKMDSDTRGGAAFSFRYAQKKPILFVGTGEKIDNLEQFHADRVAGTILGMGDVVSLAERAQEHIKQSDQDAMYAAFASGRLTLQDFADQLAMVSRLGSLSQIMRYMPGLGGANVSQDTITQGETDIKRFRAIIGSMTSQERLQPTILNASRKQRIAKGAGVGVTDINRLLERFEQSQQYVKLFKKFSRDNRFFR